MGRAFTVAAIVAASMSLRCALFLSTDGYSEPAPSDDASTSDAPSNVTPNDATSSEASADTSSPSDPTTFASGQGPVSAFATNAGTLYWSAPSQGAVRSCPLAGCTTPVDIAKGYKPNGLCFKGRLIWGDEVAFKLFYVDDAAQVASTDTAAAFRVYCDSKAVYLRGPYNMSVAQTDPPTQFTTFMSPDVVATFVAPHDGLALADTTKVYLVENGTGVPVADDVATAVALDAAQIFWATKDGRLRARARTGGAIADLASALPEPAGIVSDPEGVNVYFSVHGTAEKSYLDGFVAKVPRGGGPYTVIAKDQARPEAITLVGGNVYWSNSFDGTIRRTPK